MIFSRDSLMNISMDLFRHSSWDLSRYFSEKSSRNSSSDSFRNVCCDFSSNSCWDFSKNFFRTSQVNPTTNRIPEIPLRVALGIPPRMPPRIHPMIPRFFRESFQKFPQILLENFPGISRRMLLGFFFLGLHLGVTAESR